MKSHFRSSVVCGLTIAAGLAWSGGAMAQQMMLSVSNSVSIGDGPGGRQIPRSSLARYSEILSLTEEQRELAGGLYEGYSDAMKTANKVRREAIEAVRQSAEETEDHSVWRTKMPEIEKSFRESATKLERDFMTDLHQLLTQEQDASWTRVEQMRRRETLLRGGSLSGESVDLIEVVHGMKLPEAAPLSSGLESYADELDRALEAKAQLQESQRGAMGSGGLDMEKFQKARDEAREVGMRIRGVNERYARLLEEEIPEDRRAEFRNLVKQRTFPSVYRASHAEKMLAAVDQFDDLDAAQREAITSLNESLKRDLRAANEALASAIREDEEKGAGGSISTGDGSSTMMIRFGDEPEAIAAAKKSKREVTERAKDRLNALLNEKQRERLPKPAQQGLAAGEWHAEPGAMEVEMIGGPTEAVIIQRAHE